MKSKHTITDNFLPDDEFVKVRDTMMGHLFPWYLNDGKVFPDDGDYQLTHTFYHSNVVTSEFFINLKPIIERLESVSLLRIKANLNPKECESNVCDFHCDFDPPQRQGWVTSILYINTNNGYTSLKDGTKIKSVANRFITFPCSTMHNGATCTDENVRVLINFNYISKFFTLPI